MPRKEYYYSADERAMRAVNRRLRLAQAAKNPDAVVYNDRVVIRTTHTTTCENKACGKEFSFVMTTKAHRYCDECKATREKRRLRTRKWVPRDERPSSQSPRRVRYAGYDPSERALEGDHEDA